MAELLPPVDLRMLPQEVQTLLGLVSQNALEIDFLATYYLCNMPQQHQILIDLGRRYSTITVQKLRQSLRPDNPVHPEVGDRLKGLTLAFIDLNDFLHDQELNQLPNFGPTLRARAQGLADKKTQEVRQFRTSASVRLNSFRPNQK
jgi:hypothetical protein